MDIKKIIKDNNLEELFTLVKIGLEKEGQRVLEGANISKTSHPKVFGIRHEHPYIQTDFAESQIELITTPENNEKDVIRILNAIHEVVLKNLPENEYIWPLSMPAKLPNSEDIQVAQFDNKSDVEYREYLVEKYGKYKQMVSGIHYNFQLDDKLMEKIAVINGKTLVATKNDIYMKLARQFIRYQWLLIYLYGASPFAEDKYFVDGKKPDGFVRSLRTSRYGYVNEDDIVVSYASLDKYIKDLTSYVKTNKLIAEKEFYSSVRFRGAETVSLFPEIGIKYIEFRLFDLNPFAPFGILEKDVRFIHLFLKTLVWMDEVDKESSEKIGREYSERIALSNPLKKLEYLEEGLDILENMKKMIRELNLPESDIKIVEEKEDELIDPSLTIAAKLVKEYEREDSIVNVGMELAKYYKNESLKRYYSLNAYENMELSTQALIEDAIKNGIKVQVIDENDQFLRLEYKDKMEYVKNGNMTSKDSYISPLIMENKVVTKKILAEKGFRVPLGYEVSNLDEALLKFNYIKNKPIVIKPKSTNFGLGVTIFKNGINSEEKFSKAVNLALKEDNDIIIEEFIEGTEYRFFVIEGKTRAVLLRTPANVIGDGKHTISELVIIKNNDLLRGDAKKTPLKKIELGEIEKLQLNEQGLTFDTVLKKGEVAYLRENSNISTGGDSIDVTDEVHESYKKLAIKMTEAMQARVCGMDLIIHDINIEATNSNYGVIEANFNPMMMMHIYPHKGKSRRVSLDVLRMLFPDKAIN
ncbi:bifunctional glutamate--cysteine ligase GshA/glutathione synthetase GshB [Gemella cuniculi]|uniref:bifunctional glutamate--cysteine ligase GshA/glutathione synthetase GshB n=1 Tax=Gemella cuniculi TaxID=150240 RepID=UPI00042A2094|nr:bifunctional glutamate--cysteine ligase GshA/glutathione synthetase GshB [Gemella cuniculi]